MTRHPSNEPPASPAEGEAGGDYLWDRSGPPEADVQRLESMLSGYAYKGGKLPDAALAPRKHGRPWYLRRVIAAAAAVALAFAGWLFVGRSGGAWRVEPIAGEYTLDGQSSSARQNLAAGQWLQTPGQTQARIHVPGLGRVDVLPGSRIQLAQSGPGPDGRDLHRLELPRGSIDVLVSAPPRVFFVDTPAATAVDYGCSYVLETDEHGEGVLRVRVGLVKLVRRQAGGAMIESSVYAGMRCRIIPGSGPGTPYLADTTSRFQARLADIDSGLARATTSPADLDSCLQAALSEARRSDGVSLWHLLPRVDGERREKVYARLAELVPPPKGVAKDRVLALDAAALERWWREIW